MCQILKMAYSSGSIIVDVSSSIELTNCIFELFTFDFLKDEYNHERTNIRQAIGPAHVSRDTGIYRFKYSIPNNCRVKCVISDGDRVLVSKEKFIGDRHKIKVEVEQSEIGYLYKMRSEIPISRKMISYKSPSSETRINIPADLMAGETLMFTIKDGSFRPRFESRPEFADCFIIEW